MTYLIYDEISSLLDKFLLKPNITPYIVVMNPSHLKDLQYELLHFYPNREDYKLFCRSLVLNINNYDLQVYVDKYKKKISIYGR